MQTQSIQNRLTRAFISLSVIPLILVATLALGQGLSYKTEALRLQEQLAQRVAVDVEAFITSVENQLQLAIQMEGAQKLGKRESFGPLFTLLQYGDVFEELTFLDKNGNVLNQAARVKLVASDELGSYAGQPEFENPILSNSIYYSPVRFDDLTGEPLMTIALPIIDERSGDSQGVLVADVRLKKIWELIGRIPLGLDQTVYIVDEEGRVIAHPNPSVVLRGTLYSTPSEAGITSGLGSRMAMVAMDKIQLGSQSLTIVAEQGLLQALALPINLVTTTLVISILAFIAAGLSSVRSARRIVKPIQDLAAAARSIREGDLSQHVPIKEEDEVGELAETFNTMTEQLHQTLQGLSTELAERQRIADELRESEAKTRALLDAIPDTIFVLDAASTFIEFIPGLNFRPLIPPEQFIGKKVGEVLPAELAERVYASINTTLAEKRLQLFEYMLPADNQPRYYEARLIGSGPQRVLVVIREITAQKLAETDRENLIRELKIKNSELDQFTYTVSHDLKSPLITLRGFLRYLEIDASTFNRERLNRDVLRINESVDKMERMIKELLDLSSVGQLLGSEAEVPFAEIVDDALSRVHGRLEARQIKVEVSGELPHIHGDRNRLVQVVQNLLDNAAKFMGRQENPLIEIGTALENGNSFFYVRDNGIGLPPEFHDKVFGIFDKLDARSEGTGIGLALVKRIIEAHGGRIWIESDGANQGTTVCFTLRN